MRTRDMILVGVVALSFIMAVWNIAPRVARWFTPRVTLHRPAADCIDPPHVFDLPDTMNRSRFDTCASCGDTLGGAR